MGTQPDPTGWPFPTDPNKKPQPAFSPEPDPDDGPPTEEDDEQ